MEITWLGHCCFLLKGSGISIVTDPFDDSLGYKPGPVQADLVTVSGAGGNFAHADRVTGRRKVIQGPGEYEVADVFIFGSKSFRDSSQGSVRGKNTVYRFQIDGLTLCHLGAIGHVPTTEQISAAGSLDVLFLPVGGPESLTPSQAAEVVALLQPRITVPMLFKPAALNVPLVSVDAFLKEQGVTAAEPVARLSVTPTTLPPEPLVVVLEPRQQR